jgi:TonB family protein
MMRNLVVTALVLLVTGCISQPSRPPQIAAAGGLEFPPAAAAQRVEGYVLVVYDVGVDGTVANARVVESDPPGVFDEAALKAVSNWRFQPAVERGEIVPAQGLTSRVDFKLGESEAYVR